MGETFWTVGEVVRKLRERRGWIQEQLAEAAGVDKSTISRLEEKGGGVTKPATLQAVANALRVSVADIHAIAAGHPISLDLLKTLDQAGGKVQESLTKLVKAPKMRARKDNH